MGSDRTLPQDFNQASVVGGRGGSDGPDVRAKPHPAGFSKETLRLFGQEPSVQATIIREGGDWKEKVLSV